MKKIMSIGLLVLILVQVALADIQILDPKGAISRDSIYDEITFTVMINETAPDVCWYDLIDEITEFTCKEGMNTFDIFVPFFGENYIEVSMNDTEGIKHTDSQYFDVVYDGVKKIEESPGTESVTLDGLLCFDGTKCLWDDDNFLQYFLLVLILGMLLMVYFDQENKKVKK